MRNLKRNIFSKFFNTFSSNDERRIKMKHYIKHLSIIFASAIIISGCASTGNSDNYFGYNNDPKPIENEDKFVNKAEVIPTKTKDDWVNPFSQEYSNAAQTASAGENITIVNQYTYPSYVPVVVPWWGSYNGYYSRPHSGFYISHSYYPRHYYGWDWYWYSPYYDYNPYYGYRIASRPWWYDNYWYGGYVGYSGYSQSRKSEKKVKTVRNFGPSRGGVYSPTSRGTNTGIGSSSRGSSRTGMTSTGGSSLDYSKPDKNTNDLPHSTSIRKSSRTTSSSTKYLPNKGGSSNTNTNTTNSYKPSNKRFKTKSTGSTYKPSSSGSSYKPSSTGSSRSTGTSVKSGSSRSSGTSVGSSSSSGSSSSGSSGSKSSGSSRGSRRK